MNKRELKKTTSMGKQKSLLKRKKSLDSISPSLRSQNKLGTKQNRIKGLPTSSSVTVGKRKTYGTISGLWQRLASKSGLLFLKASMVAVMVALSVVTPVLIGIGTEEKSLLASVSVASAWGDDQVDVWWPVDGAKMSGVQPLKAMVKNSRLDEYKMYWQVDNGERNEMYDSFSDYPHKEAMVDLSGWTWKGDGPYTFTFSAFNNKQEQLGQRFVTIYINRGQEPEAASSQPALAAAVSQSASENGQVEIWWPSQNSVLSGTQPFKAMLQNFSVSDYTMYWLVDGGEEVLMDNSYQDHPHKESVVDLSGWSWKGQGPYTVTITARNSAGLVMGQSSVSINISSGGAAAQAVSTKVEQSVISSASLAPVTAGNPFAGAKLYVKPNGELKRLTDALRQSQPQDAALLDKIAGQPAAIWLGGWNNDIEGDTRAIVNAANSQGAVPVLVLYNIPQRDCGSYSAGGAGSPDGYRQWISGVARGIGGSKAAVILEPDAIALNNCLSDSDKQVRFNLIRDAIVTLRALGNTAVYLDAAHAGWLSADDMAGRLKQAGIEMANGFALNTSNFVSTEDNVAYGQSVSSQVGGKHFVIDTARNGSGPTPDRQWCNPSGRSLGLRPTANTGNSLIDAYLWVKVPGESDGNCNGGPNAGIFWPEYALDMARRTNW